MTPFGPYQYWGNHVFSMTDAMELNALGFAIDTSALETNGTIYGTSAPETVYAFEFPNNAVYSGDSHDTIVFTPRGSAYTVAVTGNDSISVTPGGAGAVVLTGANTFTGGANIAGGATLQIGAGGTAGSVTGNVTDQGALVFDRPDNVTFAGVVTGSGSLAQDGTGALTLTRANTYTGVTTVAAGALKAGAPSAFSAASATRVDGALDLGGYNETVSSLSGAGTVTNSGATAATLNDRGASSTFSEIIRNGSKPTALNLNLTTGATLTLSGSDPYTGGTIINSGTLSARNGAALGSGGVTVAGAGALEGAPVSSPGAIVVSNAVAATGTSPRLEATRGNTLALDGVPLLLGGGSGSTVHFGSARTPEPSFSRRPDNA